MKKFNESNESNESKNVILGSPIALGIEENQQVDFVETYDFSKQDFENPEDLEKLEKLEKLEVYEKSQSVENPKRSQVLAEHFNSTKYNKSRSNPRSNSLNPSQSTDLSLLLCEGFDKELDFDKDLNIVIPEDIDIPKAKALKSSITRLLKGIDSIIFKGYINSPDHPLFNYILEKYFKDKDGKHPAPSLERYELIYNILLMNLYLLGKNVQNQLKGIDLDLHGKSKKGSKDMILNEEGIKELMADYDVCCKGIFGRIKPLIRNLLSKRGLSVKHNVYTGFDTEYHAKDDTKNINELLSVQLASNNRFIISVPLNYRFNYKDEINTLTGAVYFGKSSDISMVCFNDLVNNLIKRIRVYDYKDYDIKMSSIIKKLEDSGLLKVEIPERGIAQFITNFTETKTLFKIINKGEGYKFVQLLEDSYSLIEKDIEKGVKEVFEMLGFENFEDFGYNLAQRLLERKALRTSTVLDNGVKLSISLSSYIYVCCHLSAADLSMLEDFESLKKGLDIVQKTFVTLGKMKKDLTGDYNVYIRDTTLLAPQGFKSLKSVGSMYEGDFSKIDLPGEYRGNMDKLLEDNPKLFEEYAIQDSIITLKHANTMEDFSIKETNKAGVPLTLSSLGRDYILKT